MIMSCCVSKRNFSGKYDAGKDHHIRSKKAFEISSLLSAITVGNFKMEKTSKLVPPKSHRRWLLKQCRTKKKPLTVDEGKAKENDIEQDLREMSSDDLPFQWSFLIHLWHPRHRYLYANKTLNTCGKWFAKIHNFLERFIYKSCICVNT